MMKTPAEMEADIPATETFEPNIEMTENTPSAGRPRTARHQRGGRRSRALSQLQRGHEAATTTTTAPDTTMPVDESARRARREHALDDVPISIKKARVESLPPLTRAQRRAHVTDDVPLHIKKARVVDEEPTAESTTATTSTDNKVTTATTTRQNREFVKKENDSKRLKTALTSTPLLIEAFTAERSEARVKKTKGQELKVSDPKDIPDWNKMQAALNNEWGVWSKYDAITVVPPKLARHVDARKVLESRAVWTDKATDGGFEPKCRIVGKGFQEHCDETLRRDSPTTSTQMVHMVCSVISSLKLKLTVADVTAAFLQGQPIDRELYFKMPTNLGKASIPRVEAGSLLRLNNSIYGTNDAARAWYLALSKVLREQGWVSLSFEPASFIKRNGKGQIIGIMCLHVGDLLMGIADGPEGDAVVKELTEKIDFGSMKKAYGEAITYCGREYRQAPDGTVTITMNNYCSMMQPFRVPRERSKTPDAVCTETEHRGFRKVMGHGADSMGITYDALRGALHLLGVSCQAEQPMCPGHHGGERCTSPHPEERGREARLRGRHQPHERSHGLRDGQRVRQPTGAQVAAWTCDAPLRWSGS